MDINNRIAKTGLPEQPLKPQTPHETAKKEAGPSIFDVDNNGSLSPDEQCKYLKKNISRKNYKYLTKKDYDKIIEDFTSYGEMKVNEYIEQKMESLKGRIEKKLSDKNEKKQFFGLAKTVPSNKGTTLQGDIEDKIFKLIDTKEYENLDEKEIRTIISDAVHRSYPTEEFTDDLLRIFTKHALANLERANKDPSMKETTIKNAGKTIEERMANLKELKQEVKESTARLLKNYERMVMFLLITNDPDIRNNAEETRDLLKEADLDAEQLEKFNSLSADLDKLKPSAQ